MFSRTVIIVFVASFSISWGQAMVIYMNHKNNEPLYPAILDFNHEYMEQHDDMGCLPAAYENLVHKVYDYLISPKDKYMKLLSPTSFYFEQSPGNDEYDDMYKFWKNITVADVLKVSNMRSPLVFTVIQVGLNRLADSCEELEKTISPLIMNVSTPVENASGLNTEESQRDMEVILLDVKSAKLVLQDLQNRVNFFSKHVLFKHFTKKIGGLSLQGLLRYTASAITSVRGSWIDWIILSSRPEAKKE